VIMEHVPKTHRTGRLQATLSQGRLRVENMYQKELFVDWRVGADMKRWFETET
jgi:hypothetical protein